MTKEKYSWKAKSAAFVTTLLYMGLFILFKEKGMMISVVILNTCYAFYAAMVVVLDRTNKFNSKIDSQLVSLGTVLAPIAVTIIDAMYAMTESSGHFEIKKASLITLAVFCMWLIFTGLSYIALTLLHRKLIAKPVNNASQ